MDQARGETPFRNSDRADHTVLAVQEHYLKDLLLKVTHIGMAGFIDIPAPPDQVPLSQWKGLYPFTQTT